VPQSAAAIVESAAVVRRRRHVLFRLVCLTEALIYLVLFGMWRSWLTPWIVFADSTDHGWVRTPELHRWADSAASAFYLALVAALVILALRPTYRTGLTAWVLALVTATAAMSVVGSLLQQHSGIAGALLTGLAVLVALAGPLLAAAPERAAVLQGGRGDATGPGSGWRTALGVGALVGAVVALAGVLWRVTGSVLENPREDDVVSFVLLGTAIALGCALARLGREGWRPLAWIMAGLGVYVAIGAVSLLVA
jgi:hypothetical protein